MPDDEIVTLDSGEQVRVTPEGEQLLIPGPDPEVENVLGERAAQEARLAEMRQAKRDALAAKRSQESDDPAVPPEKSIF
jgi:hypothetical protein